MVNDKKHQSALFDKRFLEQYAGPVMTDSRIALTELIANSWDAGASRVEIEWPNSAQSSVFKIEDNGHGMTDDEFMTRWRTLAYNRIEDIGEYAVFPGNSLQTKRKVFGRNGVGRWAGFCFGDEYYVRTWKNGECCEYKVSKGVESPIEVTLVEKFPKEGHGTLVFVPEAKLKHFTVEQIKGEVGLRFLCDPNFEVYIGTEKVEFSDIPRDHLHEEEISISEEIKIKLLVIDTLETDRTIKNHGIAWHVQKRLVGEINWDFGSQEKPLDGRKSEAKRFTFIVLADPLINSVKPDWTGFKDNNDLFELVSEKVYSKISEFLGKANKGKHTETLHKVELAVGTKLRDLTPSKYEKWRDFMFKAQERCPGITEKDLIQLADILATLEHSSSKYGLLQKLQELDGQQLDDLTGILKEWSFDMAKIVLDELQSRLKLLENLKNKVNNKETDEVHDLQPLFFQGLWIFGPEFETIEFTSNTGMTSVIKKLLKQEGAGSRNRPDFAILPDGSVGFYSYPSFDDEYHEIGIGHLVIVELKKPTVPISTDEKAQPWKYVKELQAKGHITPSTRVTCFVLGSNIDPTEIHPTEHNAGLVSIRPMTYDTVIARANSRLLKLYDRVKAAPFLNEKEVEAFTNKEELTNISQESINFASN